VTGPAELVIDTRGQRCPIPVIELGRRFVEVSIGGVVDVLSDDPAAGTDIPAWCAMRGQEYLGADGEVYRVRRLA
jgi:TusA-related sulfurtransferase